MILARLRGDRRGYMLLLGAICMPLIIAVCALTVDLGLGMLTRSRLAGAATFAADSGQAMLPDGAQAQETAQSVAWTALGGSAHGLKSLDISVTSSDEDISVSVSARRTGIFSSAFGQSGSRISVTARRSAPE